MKKKSRDVYNKTQGRCRYCGKPLVIKIADEPIGHDTFAPDHVIPRCQGGSNHIDNLLPACWICNSAKGMKDVEQYRTHVAIKAAGIPYFAPDQIAWLYRQGFSFPMIRPQAFWGEQQ